MSENSEHSPDDTEAETKTLEKDLSSKSEVKLMMDQTGAALLDEEEMPTYISISSMSRRDDSDVIDAKQQENASMQEERSPSPYPSDDQGASSIYVLSSGDETDQQPYNDEDDEDEYGDSDDMENLELDNDMDVEHQNNMKHLLDDEDDDDDDEDEEDDEEGRHNEDDEDIHGNYEAEYFDRVSADFILNKRLKNHHKKKSLSLQDLSICKNSMFVSYNKKRYSREDFREAYLNIPQNAGVYPMPRRKQLMPSKYQHVESKVKLYIKDIKEQNRRSAEKHIKIEENIIHNKSNTDHKKNDMEEIKLVANNKAIKGYAEKTIKELEIAETYDKNNILYNIIPQITLNGQGNTNGLKLTGEERSSSQNKIQMNVPFPTTQNEKDMIKTDDTIQKQQNGARASPLERDDRKFGNVQASLIQNGHQEIIYNLHDVSYDDYMRYGFNASKKTDLNKNPHIIEREQMHSKTYNNDAEAMDVSDTDNNDTTCQLRIENIKSIRSINDEIKNNNEQITFDKMNEGFSKTIPDTIEVIALKEQLNEKTIQYNSLYDTYQKQLAENLKMKQELDELRKSLTKYEGDNKSPEQKVASIQTDFIVNPAPNQDNSQAEADIKQLNNKISGNSVISTISSIEQWTDSACNLSISMKPPETAKTYSDDSIMLTDGTPRKTVRSLSRAFITSSRILQTLSNITQGKVKPESPLVQNPKRRLNESLTIDQQNDDSYQNQTSSSKKRKIADILGPSSFLQSFKISPSTSGSQSSKINEKPGTESQLNFSSTSPDKKSESQEVLSNVSMVENTENKTERTDDLEDNVKCYIYRENENSKDRSFLILAEEPAKDKIVNEKTRIRECGPYLLGNVEVRMSEINGTINIWGKEISDESVLSNENDTEISNKIKDNKKCHCCQKISYKRFNGSNLVCSTSKKSQVSAKLDLSPTTSSFPCSHSAVFNAKSSCSIDKVHTDNSYSPNIPTCEDCQSLKHKEWLKCKRIYSQEKVRSCCSHNTNVLEQKCNCLLQKEKHSCEDNPNCSKEKLNIKEHRRSSLRNLLEPNKQLYENTDSFPMENNDLICGHNTIHHQSIHDPEENCHKNHKCCNLSRNICTCELNLNQESSGSYNSPNRNEEEPLIIPKHSNESTETTRRRLKGKRVRGILMDLLRGCGDCYSPNAATSSKNCSHEKELPYLPRCSPQIKISSPCASPEPSYSNSGQPAGRCCHAYAQRIESQLEEFRIEMEKVRSRSDAILNMLNMLQSVDMN